MERRKKVLFAFLLSHNSCYSQDCSKYINNYSNCNMNLNMTNNNSNSNNNIVDSRFVTSRSKERERAERERADLCHDLDLDTLDSFSISGPEAPAMIVTMRRFSFGQKLNQMMTRRMKCQRLIRWMTRRKCQRRQRRQHPLS
jgi:hypothetical protein